MGAPGGGADCRLRIVNMVIVQPMRRRGCGSPLPTRRPRSCACAVRCPEMPRFFGPEGGPLAGPVALGYGPCLWGCVVATHASPCHRHSGCGPRARPDEAACHRHSGCGTSATGEAVPRHYMRQPWGNAGTRGHSRRAVRCFRRRAAWGRANRPKRGPRHSLGRAPGSQRSRG